MTLPFIKMHGLGNDYVYIDCFQPEMAALLAKADLAALARRVSDRHFGIGSDGLVLILPSKEADARMRIFNADGSEAMMCGNASRCVGKYLYERRFTTLTHIRLHTLSGVKVLNLHLTPQDTVDSVTVDMGEPVLVNDLQFLPDKAPLPQGIFVSMGNPHYVIFVDDVETMDVAAEGSRLEHHSAFPQRANIEFAEMRPDGIRVRVWERGSGITMACGTGACATTVAAAMAGRADRSSHIIMDGGELDIEWRESDGHVYMTGGAEFVFDGEIEE